MGISTVSSDVLKPSDDELASMRRAGHHFKISVGALCIPFALSGIILASGNHLSEMINIDPNSILFRLWPFNQVYLQQFTSSTYDVYLKRFTSPHYDTSEIKWFFTVVSCSNAIWLIFLCWKLYFDLFRRDVEFPRGKTPAWTQAIVRFLIISCFLLVMDILVLRAGFSTQGDGLSVISLEQSITLGAIKIVMVLMFFLYVGATVFLEFGGLGLRYVLAKKFGYFLAEAPDRPPST
jgi:hypothetical protein